MANRDKHYKGYDRNQVANKYVNTGTNKQQETLVHIISILKVTRYVIQVNRQKLDEVMDTL